MNSAAYDIKERIVDLLLVATSVCFKNEEPAAPNDVVTIYDTGGGDPFSEIELYDTTIQIRVRNVSYESAYALHDTIRRALIAPTSFEINGTKYIGVWNVGDIISLGKDQNNRSILTTNYRIERQPL